MVIVFVKIVCSKIFFSKKTKMTKKIDFENCQNIFFSKKQHFFEIFKFDFFCHFWFFFKKNFFFQLTFWNCFPKKIYKSIFTKLKKLIIFEIYRFVSLCKVLQKFLQYCKNSDFFLMACY